MGHPFDTQNRFDFNPFTPTLCCMSKVRQRRKKTADYPEQTVGSRLAAEARKMSNSMTEQQRADYFKQAVAMIYGASGKKTVRSGR